jgi:hypothetical protein
VIPHPAFFFIKALLFEYHGNVDQPNYCRLMTSLLKRYWWDKMELYCKLYCQHCVIYNRAKPDRRGGASLQPLEIYPGYPWEIVGIYFVADLPKRGLYGYTFVFYYGLSPI